MIIPIVPFNNDILINEIGEIQVIFYKRFFENADKEVQVLASNHTEYMKGNY